MESTSDFSTQRHSNPIIRIFTKQNSNNAGSLYSPYRSGNSGSGSSDSGSSSSSDSSGSSTDPDEFGTNSSPFFGKRRRSIVSRIDRELWVRIVRCLLVPLAVADLASLFTVLETTLRSTYLIIWAITISLTLLVLLLPFIAGRMWRKRAWGGAKTGSNYPLVAVLLLAWLGTIVGITYLRFAVDIIPATQVLGATASAGAAGATVTAGSSIASLGHMVGSTNANGSQALALLLTLMLVASGAISFCIAWAAIDPLQQKIQRLETLQLELQESLEDLLALDKEYENLSNYHQSLCQSDLTCYQAAQNHSLEEANELKQRVRINMSSNLGDPAATSVLSMPISSQTVSTYQSILA